MSGISPASNYFTTDDGIRLYYESLSQEGGGAPVLVIPNGICLLDDFRRFAESRTVIAYDVRNRGASDPVSDAAKLARGILNDVDDLDALRRHLGVDRIDLLGHSYMGLMVILYAMRHPEHVNRVVPIGAPPPHADTQYPPQLSGAADGLLPQVFQKLGELRTQLDPAGDPAEAARKFWEVLRVIYVANPEDAGKLNWMRYDLPNELNFMGYWTGQVQPSIQKLRFEAADFAKATAPILLVHGVKDRNAAYGGARDWALNLPDARLVTVPDTAHAPWIEAPDAVFPTIATFLKGDWPDAAEKLTPAAGER